MSCILFWAGMSRQYLFRDEGRKEVRGLEAEVSGRSSGWKVFWCSNVSGRRRWLQYGGWIWRLRVGEDFGARADHCAVNITACPKITNILERRSSPVIKDGAYQDITYHHHRFYHGRPILLFVNFISKILKWQRKLRILAEIRGVVSIFLTACTLTSFLLFLGPLTSLLRFVKVTRNPKEDGKLKGSCWALETR